MAGFDSPSLRMKLQDDYLAIMQDMFMEKGLYITYEYVPDSYLNWEIKDGKITGSPVEMHVVTVEAEKNNEKIVINKFLNNSINILIEEMTAWLTGESGDLQNRFR